MKIVALVAIVLCGSIYSRNYDLIIESAYVDILNGNITDLEPNEVYSYIISAI
jgi:hypothetical protein